MAYEDVANEASDFRGDVQEGIKDAVVDIAEFAQNELESYGEEFKEALENGDLEGAMDCLDISEEQKEVVKEKLIEFGVAHWEETEDGTGKKKLKVDWEQLAKGIGETALGVVLRVIGMAMPVVAPMIASTVTANVIFGAGVGVAAPQIGKDIVGVSKKLITKGVDDFKSAVERVDVSQSNA